jgi:hypothetical protein
MTRQGSGEQGPWYRAGAHSDVRAATTLHCHRLTPHPPLRQARLPEARLLRQARLLQARRRTRLSRDFGGLRAEFSRANCSMARPLASCAFSAA